MNLKEMEKSFRSQGYIIVDLEIDDSVRNELNDDVARINQSNSAKLNPDIYHYNQHPRLIEGWRNSDRIKELALNDKVLEILRFFFKSNPLPFSTINFTYGTEQPLHSDYVHFGSVPELLLAGVWVALEDIHPDSGPLDIVPKSHKLPIFYYDDLPLTNFPPKNISQIKHNYTLYEKFIEDQIQERGLSVVTPKLLAGEALIWDANLLHGAGQILDNSRMRRSQVTHYHFEKAEFFYNPNFSTRENKVLRDINESLIS